MSCAEHARLPPEFTTEDAEDTEGRARHTKLCACRRNQYHLPKKR